MEENEKQLDAKRWKRFRWTLTGLNLFLLYVAVYWLKPFIPTQIRWHEDIKSCSTSLAHHIYLAYPWGWVGIVLLLVAGLIGKEFWIKNNFRATWVNIGILLLMVWTVGMIVTTMTYGGWANTTYLEYQW